MDKRIQEKGIVLTNSQVGTDLFIIKVGAPEITALVKPGQFVHALIPGMEAHILRRPFSIYDADANAGTLEILYQCVGFGTRHMRSLKPNDVIDVLGPLGGTWTLPQSSRKVLLVAGGVGAAPLYMLAKALFEEGCSVDVVMGARSKEALVCYSRYKELLEANGFSLEQLRCATDDGSFGHAGFNTDLVEQALSESSYDVAYVCGPEPMMKRVVSQVLSAGVACELSLEKRMACGIGACLSCIVQTSEGQKKACVDGPIFDAEKVIFDDS